MTHQIYIGTYTFAGGEGIYRLSVSKDGFRYEGGEFAENPSYLCFSPDHKTLYAALEVGPSGKVRAYRVKEDGSLSLLNEEFCAGGGSCHVSASPDGKWLFVANYGFGSESVFPLNEDGSILPIARHIVHKGQGPDPKRQEKPHVHFSQVTPDQKWLAICDLGLDGIYLYPYGPDFGVADPCYRLSVPDGDGPRHLTFSKDGRFLYLLTEMGANVVVYQNEGGRFSQIQVIHTLPEGYDASKWGAAIRLSPDGRFVTTSNRGHDSLTVFQMGPDGRLSMTQNIASGGVCPRDFDYTLDGELLIVAHQEEGGLSLFEVDRQSGKLLDTGLRFAVDKAVNVLTGR